MFLGEVLSIFEGNMGILNIYSQQNEPKTMMANVVWTHIIVCSLVIILSTMSYLAYGNMIQDIVLYNIP